MDLSFLGEMNLLNTLLYALVSSGALSTLIHQVWRLIGLRKEKKEKERKEIIRKGYVGGMFDFKDINIQLQNLREEEGCSHSFIFYAHDHGHEPSVDNPFFISYIYGAGPSKKSLPANAMLVKDIKEQPVQPGDVDVLLELFNSRGREPLLIELKNIKNSFIADYFTSHNVKNVITHYIDIVDNGIYFIVVARETPFTNKDLPKFSQKINIIRNDFLDKIY